MDNWFCYQAQYNLLHELRLAVDGIYYMPHKAVKLVICKPLPIKPLPIYESLPLKIKKSKKNGTHK